MEMGSPEIHSWIWIPILLYCAREGAPFNDAECVQGVSAPTPLKRRAGLQRLQLPGLLSRRRHLPCHKQRKGRASQLFSVYSYLCSVTSPEQESHQTLNKMSPGTSPGQQSKKRENTPLFATQKRQCLPGCCAGYILLSEIQCLFFSPAGMWSREPSLTPLVPGRTLTCLALKPLSLQRERMSASWLLFLIAV